MTMSTEKRKALRNLNPAGVKFPKFIVLENFGLKALLKHKKDLDFSTSDTIQRFIIPDGAFTRTKYIYWRRTKRTKVYTVTSRLPMKSYQNSQSPLARSRSISFSSSQVPVADLPFIASVRLIHTCTVSKETRVSDDLESVLQTLKPLLQRFGLNSGEDFEELVIPVMPGRDGRCYVLTGVAARVLEMKELVPAQTERLQAEVSVCEQIEERIRSKALPFLSMSDILADSKRLYQTPVIQSPPPDVDPAFASHLNDVVAKFDRLRVVGQSFREDYRISKKVDLSKYPQGFLDKVIGRMYENIMSDPRLGRYFLDKTVVRNNLKYAVTLSIQRGRNRNLELKMMKAHRHMGVTDADFDLYVHYFLDAMRSECADDSDIEEMNEFLCGFRSEVVISAAARDLGVEEYAEGGHDI